MKKDPILRCLDRLGKDRRAPALPPELPFPREPAPKMSWAQVFSQPRNKMGQDTCQSTATTAKQTYVDKFFRQYDCIGYQSLPSPERDYCKFLFEPITDAYQQAQALTMNGVSERPLAWANEMEMSQIVTTRNGLTAITTAVECYLKLPKAALQFCMQPRDPMGKEKNAPCDAVFVLDKNPGVLVEEHPALVPRAASRASSLTSSRSSHNSHRSMSSMSSTSSQASIHSNWVPPPPSRPLKDNTPSHHVCRYGYAEFKRTAVISDLLVHIKDLARSPNEPIAISEPSSALTAPQYVKVLSQVSN